MKSEIHPPPLLGADALHFGYPQRPLFSGWSGRIGPGVSLVCGGDGAGKTTLLRLLAGELPAQAGQLQAGGVQLAEAPEAYRQQVFWVDARADGCDELLPDECFARIAQRHPTWRADLLEDLLDGLQLTPHRGKRLFMLSTGSRRKVWLAAAFAAGTPVTLLDEPVAALDKASIGFVTELLQEAAQHPTRAWVVADYQAPRGVPLAATFDLGD